jgi:hypothetical protein
MVIIRARASEHACTRRSFHPCLHIATFALACAWAATACGAPKTDVLRFVNGDHLTGEFKGLDHGKMRFSTDATDTIAIQWNKVASLKTSQELQVELASGARYLGQMRPGASAGSIQIVPAGGITAQDIRLLDIVRINVIDQGKLIEHLDGYVTGGYDYTKASELQTFMFTGGVKTRDELREISLDGSVSATHQTDVEDTDRFNVTANYRRLLLERRFYQGFGSLEGNDELGLDLRTTLGGAFGLYLAQDSHREWVTFAGLALTSEQFHESDPRQSIEAVLGTSYSLFRFEATDANIDASLFVLPSLTESGRVRSEATLKSRYEMIKDLFFEVSVYGSYDSEPDEDAESNSDYGLTTSLGYSF